MSNYYIKLYFYNIHFVKLYCKAFYLYESTLKVFYFKKINFCKKEKVFALSTQICQPVHPVHATNKPCFLCLCVDFGWPRNREI